MDSVGLLLSIKPFCNGDAKLPWRRYGIGSAPPYFAAGYVPQSKWYQLGFMLSIYYLAVWLFIGGAWWKVIGLW